MRPTRMVAGLMMLSALSVALAGPSSAGWLSRLAREVAEGGGGAALKTGKLGLGALDNAAAHVAALPKMSTGTALAAHVTPEGHWKFVNREGSVFTAGTPDELARVGATLAPEAAAGDRLALYLSEETVFARRASLKELPADADLHVVVGNDAYRLRRAGASDELIAEFRPNVIVSLTEQKLFEEAVYRLSRPLNRSNIRVLALESGGPRHLSSAPRYDPASKAALADHVDPTSLPEALRSLRGQTALVSGRIEGDVLYFRPSSGPEQALDVTTLIRAAEAADVNLVLLRTAASHQPGARNWFWQKVAVAGLDDALKRATFADFLSALGGTGNELTVKTALSTEGRILFSATPAPSPAAPITDTLGDWIGEVTGNVVVKAAEVYARDATRERELDARIVPGIPSAIQYAYLGALVAGLIAWQVSFPWWSRIWPPEQRQDYAGRLGYVAARVARFLARIFVFLPLVGIPALIWLGILQLWSLLTAPFRGLRWLRARFG
jgi:hypothetical protein